MEDQILDVNEDAIDYRTKVASKGIRFANMLIDSLLVGIPISLFSNYMVYGEAIATRPSHFTIENQLSTLGLNGLIYLFYYILMEHNYGKTIGKMMTETKVVNHLGQKPTLGQIIGRTFARYIPLEPFSFLGSDSWRWHDSLSKTYVIVGK